MRMHDKLRLINTITNKPLNLSKEENEALNKLRKLRNHIIHFNPPMFAVVLEDVAYFLNLVPKIGTIIWKIREAIDHPLNTGLIKLILLPKVLINRKHVFKNRSAISKDIGAI
jgi:hypothetical protein